MDYARRFPMADDELVHEPPPEVPLGAPPEVGPVGGLGAVSARRTGDLLGICCSSSWTTSPGQWRGRCLAGSLGY